jgi:hypothetical protein
MHSSLLILALTAGAAPPDVVLVWNDAALEAIRAERTPPPLAARDLAVVHAAVFDAVNAVERTHRPFRFRGPAPEGASVEVAAAVAAHRALVALYPRRVASFDAALDACCAAVPEGPARDAGARLGLAAAEDLLAWRAGDGALPRISFRTSQAPGRWRPTPPRYAPALLPQWPRAACFCLTSAGQFRPPPPPDLSGPVYVAAWREVKALGASRGSLRTAEQTEIARFWADGEGTVTPPGHWNRIAQEAARARRLTTPENARLFALLNIALADAGIACWEGKYHHAFWRPIQGIREADPSVTPGVAPDPSWSPLLETPPFPAYPSGHSTFSGAAAEVLAAFFGTDEVRFRSRSDGLPGVERAFDRFSAAAAEAGMSRIYGGIHWSFDNTAGLELGRAVGRHVGRTCLVPVGGP